jgi:hypothetical protein
MEADWSVELGADDAVIVVPWQSLPGTAAATGFVDLRARPECIREIEEARDLPALRFALERLNGKDSGLWTAKCDAWVRGRDVGSGNEIDPWEMEATDDEARLAAGSYIDILALDVEARGSFEVEERWLRRLVEELRRRALRCARTDFVLRRAEVHGVPGFGVTWFVEGCGRTAELARQKWAEALAEALPTVMNVDLV